MGLCDNYWLWAHITIAMAVSSVSRLVFTANSTLIILVALMVVWEIYEYLVMYEASRKVIINEYGTFERYWYDTIGDFVTPLVICLPYIYFTSLELLEIGI